MPQGKPGDFQYVANAAHSSRDMDDIVGGAHVSGSSSAAAGAANVAATSNVMRIIVFLMKSTRGSDVALCLRPAAASLRKGS